MTDFEKIRASAAESLAKTALANPFMFPVGVELVDARRALVAAQLRADKAEKAWADWIAPARGWAPDPLAVK